MNRVRYRGESFVVERSGKPFAKLCCQTSEVQRRELASLLRSLPKPDSDYLEVVEELIAKQPPLRSRDGTLIDSSVLIAAERGRLQFDEITARYSQEDVAISAVTASELLHGVHRARTASNAIGVRPS